MISVAMKRRQTRGRGELGERRARAHGARRSEFSWPRGRDTHTRTPSVLLRQQIVDRKLLAFFAET